MEKYQYFSMSTKVNIQAMHTAGIMLVKEWTQALRKIQFNTYTRKICTIYHICLKHNTLFYESHSLRENMLYKNEVSIL